MIKSKESIKNNVGMIKAAWNNISAEANKSFEYMLHNYNTMLTDNLLVKHFTLLDEGVYDLGIKDIMKLYGDEIEKEIGPWIQKEYESGRLFDKTVWKPFRDRYTLFDGYMGYKKMFIFKNYFFQLIIHDTCVSDMCKFCNDYEVVNHFELAVIGWKEDNSNMLQPYGVDPIPSDDIMPERYWNRK